MAGNEERIDPCDHLNGVVLSLAFIPFGTTLMLAVAALAAAASPAFVSWYGMAMEFMSRDPLLELGFLFGVPVVLFWVHNYFFIRFIRRIWLRNHPGLSPGWATVLCYATYLMPGLLHAVLLFDPMWRLRLHGARTVASITAVLLVAGSWQFLKFLPTSILLAATLAVMVLLLVFTTWNYLLLADTRLAPRYAGWVGVLLVLTFANIGVTVWQVRALEREIARTEAVLRALKVPMTEAEIYDYFVSGRDATLPPPGRDVSWVLQSWPDVELALGRGNRHAERIAHVPAEQLPEALVQAREVWRLAQPGRVGIHIGNQALRKRLQIVEQRLEAGELSRTARDRAERALAEEESAMLENNRRNQILERHIQQEFLRLGWRVEVQRAYSEKTPWLLRYWLAPSYWYWQQPLIGLNRKAAAQITAGVEGMEEQRGLQALRATRGMLKTPDSGIKK